MADTANRIIVRPTFPLPSPSCGACAVTFGAVTRQNRRVNVNDEGRETVANWMMLRGYATGHGDTIQDLLFEMEAQAKGRGGPPEPLPGEGDFKLLRAENDRLWAAIRWALGEEPSADGKWFGETFDEERKRYGWRSHLRKIAGLPIYTYDKATRSIATVASGEEAP